MSEKKGIKLKNPLIVFDLEATGVDTAKDRIVEIALVKLLPNGEKESRVRRINPEMPIPAEASEIHGIYDEDVKDCPRFKQIAKSLAEYMEGADLAGFNSDMYDIPLLAEEFLRAGVDIDFKSRKAIDVQNIFHKLEPRTLVAAYKFYCDKELKDAHSAEADTLATLEVLEAQIEHYSDVLENDVEFLAEFSTRNQAVDYAGRVVYDEDGVEVFGFGKHRGKPVVEVFRSEPSYYAWMMNSDFPEYTKKVITEIRLRDAESQKK